LSVSDIVNNEIRRMLNAFWLNKCFHASMHDILREQVGKTSHVYMDDINILSNTIEQHWADLIKKINI